MPGNTGIGRVRTALAAVALAMAAQGVAAQAQAANGVGTPFELAFWQSVGTSDDPALYEAYLQQYPQGTFATLARAKVVALRQGATTPTAPAAPAPVAAPVAPIPAAAPNPVAAPAATLPAQAVGPALAMAAPLTVPGTVAATAPVANIALGQMLADLARSQQTPAPAVATPPATPLPAAVASVSPVSARYIVPQRPQMAAVPDLVLPPGFCSAADRNRFHDTVYRPAVDAAKRNNDAAVAYLKQLQTIYDGYDLGKDTAAMNALAAEARAYQADAAATFSQQAALVRAFDALMAVPLQPCDTAK